MKLYASDRTPFGRKVRIVLAELGLDYERDAAGSGARPISELARLNPALRIPILEDGDRLLSESNLIIEYLLGTYPQRAADASAPALAPALARREHWWDDRQLQGRLDALLDATVILRQMAMSGVEAAQAAYLQRHQQRIAQLLDALERRADPEGFLPGWFSVQDLSLTCALEFGAAMGIFQWRGRPRLEALMARLAQRSSVAATAPT